MIAFDTTKPYVLIQLVRLDTVVDVFNSIDLPITFGDTKEELSKYCEVVGYDLVENRFDMYMYTQCMIVPTKEFQKNANNNVYRKYVERTLTE